jgi:hypothetical protein
MPRRDVQAQPLPLEQMPAEACRIRPRRDDRDLGLTGLQVLDDVVRRLLRNAKPTLGATSRNAFSRSGIRLVATECRKRQPHRARLRIEQ